MSDGKVMIIGLDGGTWDIFCPMMELGLMPNLTGLIEDGVSGTLSTTIPPITGSAWPSFQTGKNPGKHGIFSFEDLVLGSYERRVINSQTIDGEPLWSILSRHNKRVCVINVPVTYPPYPVNGYLISGLLTPYGDRGVTYPPELFEEMLAGIGDYITFVSAPVTPLHGVRRFVDDLIYATRKRTEAALWLLDQKGEFDFFMVHFQCLDALQHRVLDYLDPRHPNFVSKSRDDVAYVREYYQVLDKMIGTLADQVDESTTLIGLSDHGFGPALMQVNINQFLQQQGLLSRSDSAPTRQIQKFALSLARRLDVFQLREKLWERRRKYPLHRFIQESLRKINADALIDWSKTEMFAWSAAGTFVGLYVNRQGREPQGMVQTAEAYEALRDRVSKQLMVLKDPETGQQVVKHVYKREEIYYGPHVEKMPDIVAQPVEGYRLSPWFNGDLVFEPITRIIGDHRMNGTVFFKGTHIQGRGARVNGANIMDIAPTVLHLLGLAVPSDMDGQVLTSLLDEVWLEAHPVEIEHVVEETEEKEIDKAFPLSEAEEKIIRKRLAGLGYFE